MKLIPLAHEKKRYNYICASSFWTYHIQTKTDTEGKDYYAHFI